MGRLVDASDPNRVKRENVHWILAERVILTNAVCFELEANKARGGNYLGTRTSAALSMLTKWVRENYPSDRLEVNLGEGLDEFELADDDDAARIMLIEIESGLSVCRSLAQLWTADKFDEYDEYMEELDGSVRWWRQRRDAALASPSNRAYVGVFTVPDDATEEELGAVVRAAEAAARQAANDAAAELAEVAIAYDFDDDGPVIIAMAADGREFAAQLRVPPHLMPTGLTDEEIAEISSHLTERVTIAAEDVGAHLAQHRPPEFRSIDLEIPPNADDGPARHETVLAGVLAEIMTMWPAGTVLVLDYSNGRYAQAMAYPPSLLTEIGQVDAAQRAAAIEIGWTEPAYVPDQHPDFKSQPVWIDNPVREWDFPIDTLPEIAAFLARAVREVLGSEPSAGFDLKLFNDRKNGGDGPVAADPPPAALRAPAPAQGPTRAGTGSPSSPVATPAPVLSNGM
jgi:hypothetical protein